MTQTTNGDGNDQDWGTIIHDAEQDAVAAYAELMSLIEASPGKNGQVANLIFEAAHEAMARLKVAKECAKYEFTRYISKRDTALWFLRDGSWLAKFTADAREMAAIIRFAKVVLLESPHAVEETASRVQRVLQNIETARAELERMGMDYEDVSAFVCRYMELRWQRGKVAQVPLMRSERVSQRTRDNYKTDAKNDRALLEEDAEIRECWRESALILVRALRKSLASPSEEVK